MCTSYVWTMELTRYPSRLCVAQTRLETICGWCETPLSDAFLIEGKVTLAIVSL